MPRSEVNVSAEVLESNSKARVAITLANPTDHVAFFLRAEVTNGADGQEILPITYDDNYIIVFPHETRTVVATFDSSLLKGQTPGLRVEGYNVGKKLVPLK
jgi:exo-1,4-beta-D-glucosaminidase